MSSIQFGQGTVVPASWLQDVNDFVYAFGGPQNIVNFFQTISTPGGAEIVGYASTFSYPAGSVGAALSSLYLGIPAPATPTTPPADSTLAFSVNEGTNILTVSVRYSSGVVKTATLTLA